MPFINLHNHSTYSDGTLTPVALAAEAARAGVKYFSLTDHDAAGGWGEMEAALKERGIAYCYGVEIGAGPHNYLHILGYGINPADPGLLASLAALRERKIDRLNQTLALLKGLGIEIKPDELYWRGSCPPDTFQVEAILRDRGLAASRKEAHQRYFAPGAPVHLPRNSPSAAEAIKIIKDAGGRAALAHPYTLGEELDLAALKDAGLEGLEAFYPRHTEEATRNFLAAAKSYGLFVTAGIDYHGPGTERDTMSGFDYSEELFADVKKLFV
ncbi:MAG: PHP domain-containing protein [Elusimicrobiales bacterium]|nr:PHP domain-containing protein [Elusimicrobiales bacterium]